MVGVVLARTRVLVVTSLAVGSGADGGPNFAVVVEPGLEAIVRNRTVGGFRSISTVKLVVRLWEAAWVASSPS
jgi:hypothetical protein